MRVQPAAGPHDIPLALCQALAAWFGVPFNRDALNDQIAKELLTDEVLRQVLSGAENIADAVAQILLARQLERIADQATNICKEVIYMVRGDDVRHKRLKIDNAEANP